MCVCSCVHMQETDLKAAPKKQYIDKESPGNKKYSRISRLKRNYNPKQLVHASTDTHKPHIIHKSWTREGKIQLCHCFDPASNHANRTWHKMLLWWCYSVGLTSPHKMNVNQKPNRRRNFAAESAIVVCLHKYTCVHARAQTSAHAHTWSMTPA